MTLTRDDILRAVAGLTLPDGTTLGARDMLRAVTIEGARIRFVIEAPTAAVATTLEPVRQAAIAAVHHLAPGLDVGAVLTAHQAGPVGAGAAAPAGAPPSLKVGRHPTPQAGPAPVAGVDRILAVGSGKGGVGKSTVASNLAVALARKGRRVGLLDADIYGPSQPRMMGVSGRPASPDGQTIMPLHAHGVTIMSIGLMVDADKAVVWRGPMLMGALQQMLNQVAWGQLDVLIIDLPPGTGDVQLTLCQRTNVTGAVIVSTPQDVALLDARKAIDMFRTLKTPILGLIENMSTFHCPHCGEETQIFGHGGVAAEAARLELPLLGALPIDIDTRLAGDAGTPVALTDGPVGLAYAALAQRFIDGGMA
ncbi:ATP-binding protein involved in chromosome partitioning [Loktanella fryxellensis]|uniref:Iron-sulfur cluster carrier protein n=1 Tax=Loktanella fryxellensis TaxID=245187 RepID=A0A1H7Z8I2_9RHOB|nr:Mrp/NBP35 family ATP-binding protein [Loktanella fryxellensis]SEM53858.1 ATP-binding protein involved in chromosome partitioning [Loktanella fryxellensis]